MRRSDVSSVESSRNSNNVLWVARERENRIYICRKCYWFVPPQKKGKKKENATGQISLLYLREGADLNFIGGPNLFVMSSEERCINNNNNNNNI